MQSRWARSSVLTFAVLALLGATGDAKVSQYLSGEVAGATFTGRSFVIAWEVIPYDGRKVDAWVGGDSLNAPEHVLKSLRLKLADRVIAIPFDAFRDIYDPLVQASGYYVMEDRDSVYYVIRASDGAGAATIWLEFRGGAYQDRRVDTAEPD